MNKVTTGIITGAAVSALGIYALSDKRSRKRISKDSKKIVKMTKNLMDKIDIF